MDLDRSGAGWRISRAGWETTRAARDPLCVGDSLGIYGAKSHQIMKFAGRKFTVAAVNRHLEFDAVGHLRLLVRRGYLQADWKRRIRTHGQLAAARQPLQQTRSGLRIVFRRGSAITSNNGLPVLWDNWNPKKESIPSIAAGSSGLDRLKHASGNSDLAIPAASRRRAGTEGRTRTRCFLRRRPEGFEIGRGRLRDRIELSPADRALQSKSDAQRTTIRTARRGGSRCPVGCAGSTGMMTPAPARERRSRSSDSTSRCRRCCSRANSALSSSGSSCSHQRQAIDQERAAALIAVEVMQQLNGAPAPHAEQALEYGTVDDRHIHGSQFFADLRKSK